jgi:hypothetical protein
MAGLCSRNLREMNDSAMLQRKTNPIAAGIPLKTAKNRSNQPKLLSMSMLHKNAGFFNQVQSCPIKPNQVIFGSPCPSLPCHATAN